jgi:hypothetical protein
MSLVERILSAAFAAVLFCVIVPMAWLVTFQGLPVEGVAGVAVLVVGGAALGVVLGVLFPRFFGWIFDLILESITSS